MTPLPTFRCALTGNVLTARDLPDPAKPFRWTAARKAMLVNAIRAGALMEGTALVRYGISQEELRSWTVKFANGHLAALKEKNIR